MHPNGDLLALNEMTVKFGGLTAVNKVSLSVQKGRLEGIIGPNGAGKTTVFNGLTGLCHVTGGDIAFGGSSILNRPADRICRLGIARTFQNIRLFKSLSALDNLRIAFHQNRHYGMWPALLHLPSYAREEKSIRKESQDMLEFVQLGSRAQEKAGSLSYGQQRRLEIARALITKPKLLLLDEPAAGMNPLETLELTELIRNIHRNLDVTVILIEHDMSLVMNLCQYLHVLDYGKLIAQGTPDAIRANAKVIEAYLGEEVPA